MGVRPEHLEGPAIGKGGIGSETIGRRDDLKVSLKGRNELRVFGEQGGGWSETEAKRKGGEWTWGMSGLQSSGQDAWILFQVR